MIYLSLSLFFLSKDKRTRSFLVPRERTKRLLSRMNCTGDKRFSRTDKYAVGRATLTTYSSSKRNRIFIIGTCIKILLSYLALNNIQFNISTIFFFFLIKYHQISFSIFLIIRKFVANYPFIRRITTNARICLAVIKIFVCDI